MKTLIASYIGPEVTIGSVLNPEWFIVELIQEEETIELGNMDYTMTPNTIGAIGPNVITITYVHDPLVKTTITLNGGRKLVRLSVQYRGEPVAVGDDFLKQDVLVTAVYNDESYLFTSDWFCQDQTVTHSGLNEFVISYHGITATIQILGYEKHLIQLYAVYEGISVPIGSNFSLDCVKIKGKYDDGSIETIQAEDCQFDRLRVVSLGPNYITVTYQGIGTSFLVNGQGREALLTGIQAKYIGPPIEVGNDVPLAKVICSISFSDGRTETISNYSIDHNTVTEIGINRFLVSFQELQTTFMVLGTERRSTTESGESEIPITYQYPEAVFRNNRFRGPAESKKRMEYIKESTDNLNRLKKGFSSLEEQYVQFCEENRYEANQLERIRQSMKGVKS